MTILTTLSLVALSCAAEGEPISSVIHLPNDGSIAALRALRTPGVRDLLLFGPKGVAVRTQAPNGAFSAEVRGEFNWPSAHMAWDIVDLEGSGVFELVLLHGDGRVTAHGVDAQGAFGDARLLLKSQSYLPRGVTRMRFARDIDGDGRTDMVLPAAGIFRVYVQRDDASFAELLEIEYEADVSYDVGDPGRLDSEFGQTLSIPFFTLEDIDGDGLQDLISTTEERVDFHLACPEISQTPTWSLDLLALAEALPKSDGIDLDNLIANVEQGVKWSLEDIDGVAPRDLVMQLGATMRIYLGGSISGTSKQPDQVLKISGNLLHYFLRDVQGDELPDLQLLRGERISLGRVLRWLILPGSLDFEFFTYQNTEGAFSRKPTRRNTVTLEIPRLLSLMDDVEEIEGRFEMQFSVPASRADLDGDGEATDVIDFVEDTLLFYHDISPEADDKLRAYKDGDLTAILDDLVLDDVNRLEDGATKTIDIGDVVNWNFSPGFALRSAAEGHAPDLRINAGLEGNDPELRILDLDGDSRDDVVAWVVLEDYSRLLQFLVQAKR